MDYKKDDCSKTISFGRITGSSTAVSYTHLSHYSCTEMFNYDFHTLHDIRFMQVNKPCNLALCLVCLIFRVLDVYKRQTKHSFAGRLTTATQLRSARAVSYTHLDVYKRQLLLRISDIPPKLGLLSFLQCMHIPTAYSALHPGLQRNA